METFCAALWQILFTRYLDLLSMSILGPERFSSKSLLDFSFCMETFQAPLYHHPPPPPPLQQLGLYEDGFDDNGWGCAYRSLQTCVSWYRLQHYSEELVPSIPEIQRLLKRIDEVPMPGWEVENGEMVWNMRAEGWGYDVWRMLKMVEWYEEWLNSLRSVVASFDVHMTMLIDILGCVWDV